MTDNEGSVQQQGWPTPPGGGVSGSADTLHTHPFPKWWRLVAVAYGVGILMLGLAILGLIVNSSADDERKRNEILELIEDRREQRDREAAKVQDQLAAQQRALDDQQRATDATLTQNRVAICAFLNNATPFDKTPELIALAKQFRCDSAPAPK